MAPRDKDVIDLLTRQACASEAIAGQASTIAELATGLKLNGVIYSGTVKIGSGGTKTVRAMINFASATVRPQGADITIGTGGESDRAPTTGEGVHLIPGDVQRTVAIAGNVLVIYGTPNTLVAVTLWIRPQQPESSESHPIGVDCPNGPQRVNAATASTVLVAANPFRRGLSVFNEGTAILWLACAPTASATVYTVQVPSNELYELPPAPLYRGVVSGIWQAAGGAALVTELQ